MICASGQRHQGTWREKVFNSYHVPYLQHCASNLVMWWREERVEIGVLERVVEVVLRARRKRQPLIRDKIKEFLPGDLLLDHE